MASNAHPLLWRALSLGFLILILALSSLGQARAQPSDTAPAFAALSAEHWRLKFTQAKELISASPSPCPAPAVSRAQASLSRAWRHSLILREQPLPELIGASGITEVALAFGRSGIVIDCDFAAKAPALWLDFALAHEAAHMELAHAQALDGLAATLSKLPQGYTLFYAHSVATGSPEFLDRMSALARSQELEADRSAWLNLSAQGAPKAQLLRLARERFDPRRASGHGHGPGSTHPEAQERLDIARALLSKR